MDTWPRFDDLPEHGDTGERHAWNVFGPDDEFGTLNFIGPDQIRDAARSVTSGMVINLDLAVGEPTDPFWSGRSAPVRVEERTRQSRDDRLDNFYLQGGSQWDSLRHFRFRQYGYYGGRQDEDLDDSDVLGAGRLAERGIVGRGVLLDVDGYLAEAVAPAERTGRFLIEPELLMAVANDQRISLQPGDILLVRTGWLGWYQAQTAAARRALSDAFSEGTTGFPGISPARETAQWLWDQRIAAAATDTPAFEAFPYREADGWGHHRFLSLLGMPIGELWSLDKLAQVCREQRRYSFFLTSSPLNVPSGTGSPPNAYAIL